MNPISVATGSTCRHKCALLDIRTVLCASAVVQTLPIPMARRLHQSIFMKEPIEPRHHLFLNPASLARLMAIGAILAVIASLFLYAGGWLTPRKLTPSAMINSPVAAG